jgi:ATP-dependent DNA helicase RecG
VQVPAEIVAALRAGRPAAALEGLRLEFKQEDPAVRRTLEILADAVVCLANAEGGTVILGVSDVPGPAGAFLGVSPAITVENVTKGIYDRTRPGLSVPVEEVVEHDKRLIVITVPRGATLYANAKGVATRRVGNECRPFPPEEQRQALAARGYYDWSAAPCGLDQTAVEHDEVNRLRSLLLRIGRDDAARLDDEQLLRDLRLLTDEGLTRAGLLLVGSTKAIMAAVPTYEYAYQYRPSAGSEVIAHLRERRPILVAIDHLLESVTLRRSVHPLNVAGGVQLQLHDFPTSVVRELVVNALVHRDYEFEGAVDVEHTPQRLVVSSPGGLVFGVTPDNILSHPSTPRNRLLLETVTTLQVAERLGQGVDRVYRELLRVGKPPPVWRDDGTRVEVAVPGGTGDDAFAHYVNTRLDVATAARIDVLLALSHLRDHRTITADQLAPAIQRTASDAQEALDEMAHTGLIEASGRTRRQPFPTFALTAGVLADLGRAVSYYRPAAGDPDRKVVEHVNEYGYITNQTLRRLFDLGVYPARDLLRDLQQRGILRKLDEKTAGPGIRYGAGPSFPKTRRRSDD